MTKYAKIMISCFVAGILLIGIGCGVAFFEFSSVDYGGNKTYATNAETITETHEEHLNSRIQDLYLNISGDGGYSMNNVSIVPDETVPEDKIIFEIQYPADCSMSYSFTTSTPYDDEDTYESDGEHYYYDSNALTAEAWFGFYQQNFPKIVRQTIDDLRSNVYYNYTANGSITVKVNPVNADKIRYDH
ncbi:MAG: hypothetical protein ACOX7J_00710 [Bacillota bacterium]|jgi:hypothetical protein